MTDSESSFGCTNTNAGYLTGRFICTLLKTVSKIPETGKSVASARADSATPATLRRHVRLCFGS